MNAAAHWLSGLLFAALFGNWVMWDLELCDPRAKKIQH
jgi:hypothetical protein